MSRSSLYTTNSSLPGWYSHRNLRLVLMTSVDELYWSIGPKLVGTDALPMIAPVPGGSPFAEHPREGRLVGALRHGDELYLRYRFTDYGR